MKLYKLICSHRQIGMLVDGILKVFNLRMKFYFHRNKGDYKITEVSLALINRQEDNTKIVNLFGEDIIARIGN